jgi:hypothetical protein
LAADDEDDGGGRKAARDERLFGPVEPVEPDPELLEPTTTHDCRWIASSLDRSISSVLLRPCEPLLLEPGDARDADSERRLRGGGEGDVTDESSRERRAGFCIVSEFSD